MVKHNVLALMLACVLACHQQVSGKVGSLYRWKLPPAASPAGKNQPGQCKSCQGGAAEGFRSLDLTFSVVVSGAKPCEDFRVWVHRTERGPKVQQVHAESQAAAAMARDILAQSQGVWEDEAAESAASDPRQHARKSGDAAPAEWEGPGENVLLNAAVDVTHMAAWLPISTYGGRRHVREQRCGRITLSAN